MIYDMAKITALEEYFKPFRENIIGYNQTFQSPYGIKRIVYADWIASGRLYSPIEKKMLEEVGPYVGNTHSESSITGTLTTLSYKQAHEIIKKHVNAGPDDVIITKGSGMTAMVNKFQRILGIKVPEQLRNFVNLPPELKPVVFVTHMEHHSNHTSWSETIADVVVIEPDKEGTVDPENLIKAIEKYKNRKMKIGAFTACSNVTGIKTPYYELSKIIHSFGGISFIDFACSAPYVNIDMHPPDALMKLDAVSFSPHKFLGGPGSPGVLIFDSNLYSNNSPDDPGGGTVDWTNPWGQYKFISDIEAREDGGTPAFLQTIKAALAVQLKEKMGVPEMELRESEIVKKAFKELGKIPEIVILAGNVEDRLGALSFYIKNIHYNLVVKLLNDRFGIQVRGGCSCAGTYGHYLLHVSPSQSKHITDLIDHGDLSEKPGWVRLSFHPTTTDEEIDFIMDSIRQVIRNIDSWEKDYKYSASRNEFINLSSRIDPEKGIKDIFLFE
ncbi:MAG TPA: aminotransferase class V-fold PLP-dependent enzyme [Ignavibacteriaceae bacterium]|nr:aminotransferase class V-fold PLP-dependent enzyme [Ignavibacteriaceae bacterium]